VTQRDKMLEQILRGKADTNIRFDELRSLLLSLGFTERTRGSHHVFSKRGIEEQIVLQQLGSKASVSGETGTFGAYQVPFGTHDSTKRSVGTPNGGR
jgi:hypothetical protein